jgi:5-methylcytosine-specific restriction protein A
MKITTEMTKFAYHYSKKVFNNEISEADALNILTKDHGMNQNSAADYIHNFRSMLAGKQYARTNNEEATEYYLVNILKDFGINAFQKALFALDKHIKYYESLNKGKLPGLRKIYLNYCSMINTNSMLYPEQVSDDNYYEGLKKTITVNSYERDNNAREKCIEIFGAKCVICDLEFQNMYGEIGLGFIHIHHLTPLSEIKTEYTVVPQDDLRPVCPNCHSMLHRKNPPYTIEEMKEIVSDFKKSDYCT